MPQKVAEDQNVVFGFKWWIHFPRFQRQRQDFSFNLFRRNLAAAIERETEKPANQLIESTTTTEYIWPWTGVGLHSFVGNLWLYGPKPSAYYCGSKWNRWKRWKMPACLAAFNGSFRVDFFCLHMAQDTERSFKPDIEKIFDFGTS